MAAYTGCGYEQEEHAYFIICPYVFYDSPNRSDRVFHCFWHCHGEDGRAGQELMVEFFNILNEIVMKLVIMIMW